MAIGGSDQIRIAGIAGGLRADLVRSADIGQLPPYSIRADLQEVAVNDSQVGRSGPAELDRQIAVDLECDDRVSGGRQEVGDRAASGPDFEESLIG
jgi:hypothetical protein